MSAASGIDPRGPRFGAGITAALLLVVIGLSLGGLLLPALIIFVAQTLLFAWGAFAGIRRHPYGLLFTRHLAKLEHRHIFSTFCHYKSPWSWNWW